MKFNRYIVTFAGTSNNDLIEKLGGKIIDDLPFLPNLIVVEMDETKIQLLEEEREVVTVELDKEIEIQSEVGQGETYAIGRLKARDYWKRSITGQGVKVGIIDTGIAKHRDLVVIGGINGHNEEIPFDVDVNGHGTHVAGIVAGKMNGLMGYVGIAPDVELYSIKCDNNQGSGTLFSSAIARGVNWAIENGIHILNCSFGSGSESTTIRNALQSAYNAGMIVVASAGNAGKTDATLFNTLYPARYSFVVSVANIGRNNRRTSSSSTGKTDLACYGRSIRSTIPSEGTSTSYGIKTGTSMACPYVVGIFALYKQLFPQLTNQELITKVKNAALPLGAETSFGKGLPRPPQELYSLPNTRILTSYMRVMDQYGHFRPVKSVWRFTNGQWIKINPKLYKNGQFVSLL